MFQKPFLSCPLRRRLRSRRAAHWGLLLAGTVPTFAVAAEALPVTTIEVERLETYRVAVGYTGQWENSRETDLGFELPGTVQRIAVEEGESVMAGQLLARLDTLRLDAHRGEAAAALEEARTGRDLAELTLGRVERAALGGAVAPQRIDEAKLEVQLRHATVQRFSAQLARIDADLEKARLTAPFSGVVTRRWIDEGRVVGAGAPVLTLQESGQWELRVGLPPARAHELRAGDPVRINKEGEPVMGQVQRILPTRTAATRTIEVIVTPQDVPSALFNGDLAEVEFEIERTAEGAWLPFSALTEDARGLWACYVAAPDGNGGHVLDRRSLSVQHIAEDRIFVSGPLADGEHVVADGLHRLVVGQRVRVIPTSELVRR